jgi:hypothetical protein
MKHEMQLAEQDKAHLNQRIQELNQMKNGLDTTKFQQDKALTEKLLMIAS